MTLYDDDLTAPGGGRPPADGLTWITAPESYSNGNCVQVAWDKAESMIRIRDSKHPEGAELRFTLAEWKAFAGGMRKGDFDQIVF